MLDTTRILGAIILAGLAAADGVLLGGWPWNKSSPVRTSVGSILGLGIGFFVGCWCLGLWPHWPPTVDQARLVYILFPAIIVVELLAVALERYQWPVWILRFVIALAAARILLHGSVYLKTEIEDVGTFTWTLTQSVIVFGGLAVALAGVWTALVVLARRTAGPTVPVAVAFACAGAAVTLMYSSTLTGGLMGLPLAAAVAGSTFAAWLLPGPPRVEGILGLGIVGLFALLVAGRFFSDLTTSHALLLFFAPLLCWLPEMPYVVRLPLSLRGCLRIALTLVPITIALILARQNFLNLGDCIAG